MIKFFLILNLFLFFNAGFLKATNTTNAEVSFENKFSDIIGTFSFSQIDNQSTIINGSILGLQPGKYGFHIHEKGNLVNSCKDAGGHYNPYNVDHGNIDNGHVGDLGNIIVKDVGETIINVVAERVNLTGKYNVINRTLMIHGGEDDLGIGINDGSKKHGNAGPRIGCGVIKLIIN